MSHGRLGLDGDELVVGLDGERGLGGVGDLPDDDRGDLHRVAGQVVDLHPGGLEVADPHGQRLAGAQRHDPDQARATHRADVPPEELHDVRPGWTIASELAMTPMARYASVPSIPMAAVPSVSTRMNAQVPSPARARATPTPTKPSACQAGRSWMSTSTPRVRPVVRRAWDHVRRWTSWLLPPRSGDHRGRRDHSDFALEAGVSAGQAPGSAGGAGGAGGSVR